MTEPAPAADDVVLQRRRFISRGALLAAAAGGTIAATAGGAAAPASAATGGTVTLGKANTADAATSITSTAASEPALALTNADGPALELTAASTDSDKALSLNQLAGTSEGPVVSTYDADAKTAYTDYVATLSDVYSNPVVDWVDPVRILDTASSKGRAAVVASSSGALDAKGRLKKGAWIDVAVDTTDQDYQPAAAFATITSSGSSKDGYLSAYVSGVDLAGTVTVSFLKGKKLSGSTFVGLQAVKGSYVFRIYASQTTYVSVDLTGLSYYATPGPDAPSNERKAARPARTVRRAVARPARTLGR